MTTSDAAREPSTPAPRAASPIALYPLFRRSLRDASSSFRPPETATCRRRAHASCSAPDTTTKRLVAIDARNHRFSGGESGFAAALIEAVGWVGACVTS